MEEYQLTRPDPKAITVLRPQDLLNAMEWETIPVGLVVLELWGDQDKWASVAGLSDFLRYVNFLYEFNRLVLDPRYERRPIPKTLNPQRSRLAWEDRLKLQRITKQSPWELVGSMLASHHAIVSVGATGLLLQKAFNWLLDSTKKTAETIKAIEEAISSGLKRREDQFRLAELETAKREAAHYSTDAESSEKDNDERKRTLKVPPPSILKIPINEDVLRRIQRTGFKVTDFQIRIVPDDHPFRHKPEED